MLRTARRLAGAVRPLGNAPQVRTFVAAKLPDLDYDYGALEPVVSGEIMQLHHSKHHNTYVTNFNATLEKYAEAEAKNDYTTMIALQGALKFNGGGHINHSNLWTNMAPPRAGGGGAPTGELAAPIDASFGSFDAVVSGSLVAPVSLRPPCLLIAEPACAAPLGSIAPPVRPR